MHTDTLNIFGSGGNFPAGRLRVVDVGHLQVSSNPETVLVTYALGSCVGVAAWDPGVGVGGLAHFQLPDSALDPAKAVARPAFFADSGVRELMRQMLRAHANPSRMQVHIAGGAQVMGDAWLYDIGRKNTQAVLEALNRHGLRTLTDDTGGETPRTVYLNISNGEFLIRKGQPCGTTARGHAAGGHTRAA